MMKSKPHPTQSEIKRWLTYNKKTGKMTWVRAKYGVCPGKSAGSTGSGGYKRITINGQSYALHRIAWIYVHGSIDASLVIDHINGKPHDNRLVNLRAVTPAENLRNAPRKSSAKSGALGVLRARSRKGTAEKWTVQLGFDKGKKWAGTFSTLDEARSVAVQARLDAGFTQRHCAGL